ncbi:glycosyltransferase family A protein [Leeuwenhoekiella sp. W20_SRS_FM14]|uniref:glycosyltransferase family A protein n=1 Tax=Leeuwenhoekiella sp. W20_SRS_FM14 TaxID=3240270 RepID=UPI003F945849
MTLAIVIPFYKIDFFEETLISLSYQTNKNFKVYIGNDGSPNNPEELILKYSKTLEIIYRRYDNNLGSKSLVDHWNRCIELIQNETFLMILGDDDTLQDTCVANFHKKVTTFNEGFLPLVFRFSTEVIDEKSNPISKRTTYPEIQNSKDLFINKITGLARSSLSEYIFSTSKLKKTKIKKFPLAWHSDDLLFLEVSDFQNIISINESIVYIRSSNFNISNNKEYGREKNLASFQFYSYLLKNQLNQFTEKERLVLWTKLEKCVTNNKSRPVFLLKLFEIYFRKKALMRIVPFINNYKKVLLKNA